MKNPVLQSSLSRILLIGCLALLLSACASTHDVDPLDSTGLLLSEAGSHADHPQFINLLYDSRTWVHHRNLADDPNELGITIETPVQFADIKFLGPSEEDALQSLALKIWMIENADHTIDSVYYIFSADMVGLAVLGALCNAVKRGVDVRFMVDSIGSLSLQAIHLRTLQSCADEAGLMRNADGSPSQLKARVQVVIFNALSNPMARVNRRSHDKMIVTDGSFSSKALVLTGGRNISTAYYGITPDGQEDPDAYRDLEILVRPGQTTNVEDLTVGNVSEAYYSLLFLNKGNKLLGESHQGSNRGNDDYLIARYRKFREKAQRQLENLKGFPLMADYFSGIPEYVNDTYRNSEVLLAHELANLTDRSVVKNAVENRERNPNSIMKLIYEAESPTADDAILRIVSPYLFMSKYYDKDGNVTEDSVANLHQWLSERPDHRFEIITNSVMTSDNILAQSVIDMEVGPRLLLTPELQQAWLSGLKKGEFNPEVTESEEWRRLVNHPQIFVYQTGKLDASMFGNGDKHYGKLHAKFLIGDEVGFVGTSNFDYRSLLYNNEMGFFYRNEQAHVNLNDIFESLKDTSYRWGSPEWLEMRKAVIDKGGMKSWGTRKQRFLYKMLKKTGFIWLI
jgi:phosphatidylserine/phosphatidylglycerophosphate/cardiolipin synthase-like enzyme